MGTTCASLHIRVMGPTAPAISAISRAITSTGYTRAKKPAAPGKTIAILTSPGTAWLTILDDANADLDSGELKDTALALSRALKAPAAVTSLYDSDSFELTLFTNGRQLDHLATNAETYTGPLKQLTSQSRATQWAKLFARPIAPDAIAAAAAIQSPFAETTLTALTSLFGLPADRPQRHFNDLAEDPSLAPTLLHFTKNPRTEAPEPSGAIKLSDYFDPDNSRKLLVFPAAWPMRLNQPQLLTWLMLSEGAGFSGGTLSVDITGPSGLAVPQGQMNGAKFHNGQIVGGYELAKNTPVEEARAYLETKRFTLIPTGTTGDTQSYTAATPNLFVPAPGSTQILLILQLTVIAATEGEWDAAVTFHPGPAPAPAHRLPGARIAAVTPGWLPIASGLNPKAPYETSDMPDPPIPDAVIGDLVRSALQYRYNTMSWGDALALYQTNLENARPRSHATWLSDIGYKQKRIREDCRLACPAILHNAAILNDEGPATHGLAREAIESWLRPAYGRNCELRLLAHRQMTTGGNFTKTRKSWKLEEAFADKAWAKLFDPTSDMQSITLSLIAPGQPNPIAGAGLNTTMRTSRERPSETPAQPTLNDHLRAMTLTKMRGRPFAPLPRGTAHTLYTWVVNHPGPLAALGTSADDMRAQLDRLAATQMPLQAWHAAATWIPRFDTAENYENTIYEEFSILNFFRGIRYNQHFGLHDQRLSAFWGANILRMVSPLLWLGPSLAAQLDHAALGRVATLTPLEGGLRVEKRASAGMEDLELALLPVLPIETPRVAVSRKHDLFE
jgi:hypothetical protein